MSNEIQKINDLPSIAETKKRSQGLALLDAILMPEWEHRYFSFNCKWDEGGSEMMASMRDGSGGEYFLHFSGSGAVGKVLFEQSVDDAYLLLSRVPGCFSSFKNESAFKLDDTTFYFWRTNEDKEWFALPDNLSSYAHLGFLVGGDAYYHNWAESYYEKNINAEVLKKVFNSLSIDPPQLEILNPYLTFEDLRNDLAEILGNAEGR